MPDAPPRAEPGFDPGIRAVLLRLLRKERRHRIANRLIAFGLGLACLYLALLLGILLFGLPLLLFHLLLYAGLAALPLFLVLEAEGAHSRAVLRRVDDHCQLEAYLSMAPPRHRAFLAPRLRVLLSAPERERLLVFRLHPWNLRMAAAAGLLALAYLLSGWIAFGGLRPTLSPAALAASRAEAGNAGGRDAHSRSLPRTDYDSEGRETAGQEAGVAGGGLGPRGRKEAALGEGREAPDGDASDRPADQPTPPPPLQAPGEPSGEQAAGEQGTETGSFAQAIGEGSMRPLAPGGSEPGTGSTGPALLESPLLEHRTRTERFPAEGGKSVAADSGTSPPLEPEYLPGRFADFPLPAPPQTGFDPELQRITHRYLELLDERF